MSGLYTLHVQSPIKLILNSMTLVFRSQHALQEYRCQYLVQIFIVATDKEFKIDSIQNLNQKICRTNLHTLMISISTKNKQPHLSYYIL